MARSHVDIGPCALECAPPCAAAGNAIVDKVNVINRTLIAASPSRQRVAHGKTSSGVLVVSRGALISVIRSRRAGEEAESAESGSRGDRRGAETDGLVRAPPRDAGGLLGRRRRVAPLGSSACRPIV